MSNFRPIDRETGFLLPPSVDEWLPKTHLDTPGAVCGRGDRWSGPFRDDQELSWLWLSLLLLLRHERVWCGGPRKWVAQHGHLSRLWARATVSLRRMVAIEFGTCRSGRIGGAAGSITRGKANRFELRGGRS